jgi:hypothetical protein
MGIKPAFIKKFLYCTPTITDKSQEPVDDWYTDVMERLMPLAKHGIETRSGHFSEGAGYHGFHVAPDRTVGTNHDYLFELPGVQSDSMTNSIAAHYLRWFRNAVTTDDLLEVRRVAIALLSGIESPPPIVLGDDAGAFSGVQIIAHEGYEYALMPDGQLRAWNDGQLGGWYDEDWKSVVLGN